MSRGIWKAVETSTGKVGVREAKGRRGKGRKRKGEETKKGKDNGSKESSGEMGNMG